MQTSIRRVFPTAAELSALLPGLFVIHSRSKVYTSNVMDEARTKRITDHFNYMKACKQYSKELHELFMIWRAEIKAKEIDSAASERRRKAQELREEASRMQELIKEKQAAQLQEQIKRSELEYKRAMVQVQRAHRRVESQKRIEAARAARYQRLLEASRSWIRHEELEEAINRALDNPQPFGFIANLPPHKGF